jgi:Ni/Fe-hydrogenase 1 B-type cytochrome subunit
MWVMLVFVVIHIYMAIRADIMSRESSVSTIFGGWRMFKDDQP